MLPLARDRALVAATRQELQDTISRVAAAVEEVDVSLFLGRSGDAPLYVTYCGRYYAPAAAWTLYWPLMQLTRLQATLLPVEHAVYHVMAYREETKALVFFAEPGCENMAVRVSDAARHTGVELLAITPPLPPVIEERIYANELIEVEGVPIATGYIIAAALFASKMLDSLGGIKLRIKRFTEELETLAEVYDDIRRRYRDVVREAARMTPAAILASPTMMPSALLSRLYYESTRRLLLDVEPLSSLLSLLQHAPPQGGTILVFTTGVEADMVREASYRTGLLSSAGLKVITVDTDPLTAPLYGTMISSNMFTVGGEGGRTEDQ